MIANLVARPNPTYLLMVNILSLLLSSLLLLIPVYVDALQKREAAAAMEKVNSELVQQNCYIMEQNERLKKAAELLRLERQRLLSELKPQLSTSNHHHVDNKLDKQAAPSSSPCGSTQPSSN